MCKRSQRANNDSLFPSHVHCFSSLQYNVAMTVKKLQYCCRKRRWRRRRTLTLEDNQGLCLTSKSWGQYLSPPLFYYSDSVVLQSLLSSLSHFSLVFLPHTSLSFIAINGRRETSQFEFEMKARWGQSCIKRRESRRTSTTLLLNSRYESKRENSYRIVCGCSSVELVSPEYPCEQKRQNERQ